MVKKSGRNANKTKHNFLKLFGGLLFLALFIAALKFDIEISYFVTSFQDGFSYQLMWFIVGVSTFIILGASSLIIYWINKKKTDKKDLLGLWASIVSSWVLGALVKLIVMRPRPFLLGIETPQELIKTKYLTWDTSFPSLHAATSFAAIPFMPKNWQVFWVVIALIISFSRVYFGLHYLSDVIAGAVIGISTGYLIKAILLRKN